MQAMGLPTIGKDPIILHQQVKTQVSMPQQSPMQAPTLLLLLVITAASHRQQQRLL